jgi:hypothetical protein
MKNVGNVAFSGGASAGLAYFKIWKEIYRKNIIFDKYAGTSAGGVFGVPIMAGLSPEEGLRLFKALEGDRYLNYDKELQSAPKIVRPFMRLIQLRSLRKTFYTSCEKLLQSYFGTWELVNIRCKKSFICFLKKNDVLKYCGWGFLRAIKKHGLRSYVKDKNFNEPLFYLKNLPVYYASDDGIYTYDYKTFTKISDEIIQPWEAILSTFANPLLPKFKVKIFKKERVVIDGGIMDNFSLLPFVNEECISIMCQDTPNGYGKGVFASSDFIYDKYKPIKTFNCIPTKKRAFFDFSDESIEEEFKQPASEFF